MQNSNIQFQRPKKFSFGWIALPIIAISCAILFFYFIYHKYYFSAELTPSSFAETSDALNNPYQGWYHLYGYQLSDEGIVDEQTLQTQIKESSENRLVLLEINLNQYKDRALSAQALSMMESIFSAWKDTPCQMILRFLYDWDGNASQSEPQSTDLVKQHITQCAEVVNQFAGHVYMLQGIFVGNYGEMHGSIHLNENDVRALAKELVAATDPSIYLAVRTPHYWRMITERFMPLTKKEAFMNTAAARISIFNDGMLGSETDVGTYDSATEPVLPDAGAAEDYSQKGSRKEELEFQDALCTFVPNGGEAIIDNPCNDLENAVPALAKMHVSYLNCDYDSAVLEKWKRSVYQGSTEDCFHETDGYRYIGRHLGYRYAVTDARLSLSNSMFQFHPATLQITIKNSGFANCYRAFQAEINIKNEDTGKTRTIQADADPRLWNAASSTDITIPIDVKHLGCGNYSIYFKLTDPNNKEQIKLANQIKQDTKSGYKIASLLIHK